MDQFLSQLQSTAESWGESAIELLPNIVLALLVMVAFYWLARAARSGADKVLKQFSVNNAVARLLTRILMLAIVVAGFFVALNILELKEAAMSLVAGAGVAGIAIGFAFQDIAANFISGIALSFRNPFRVGDTIETGDITGIVQRLSLRTTELRTVDGHAIDVPNKQLFTEPLTNFTRSRDRRINVAVGVAYDSDLDLVESTTAKALQEVRHRDAERDIEVHFRSFGGSSIDLIARFWIDDGTPRRYNEALSDAVMKIKKAYDNAEIEIPFPIRTLELGSSVSMLEERVENAFSTNGKGESRQSGAYEDTEDSERPLPN